MFTRNLFSIMIVILAILFPLQAVAEIIDHDEFNTPWSPPGTPPGIWCGYRHWSTYGLPDTQIIATGGRNNSGSMVANIEGRGEPSGGLSGIFSDRTKDELFFRWYLKYDPTWSWLPNQNGQKLARIRLNPEPVVCSVLTQYVKPAWLWGRMAYALNPPLDSDDFYSDPEVYWSDYGPGVWICMETYIKLNTIGQTDGIVTSWLNGVQVAHKDDMGGRISNVHLNSIALGDNIIPGVPWTNPEEKQIWTDDFVISTEYIGPIDDTTPVISGYNYDYNSDNGTHVVTVHVTDAESGVDPSPDSLILSVDHTIPSQGAFQPLIRGSFSNYSLAISGTPADYILTYTSKEDFSRIKVVAKNLYEDPVGLYEAQERTALFDKGDSIPLDSDGDTFPDSSDTNDDNDIRDDSDPSYPDAFPKHAYLVNFSRVNAADIDSNGNIDPTELAAATRKFRAKKGEFLLPELIAVFYWDSTGTKPTKWSDINVNNPEAQGYVQVLPSTSGGMLSVIVK